MSDTYKTGVVSSVTPVYNGEKYIYKLLDSLLAQTWENVQVIIVDDGSNDNTVEAVEAYRNKFEYKGYEFIVVKCEHRNASAAIKQGLKYVTGEYLIWPDGDDELTPESIEKRIRFLINHPEYSCVRSTQKYVDFVTGSEVENEERIGNLDTRKLFWDILFAKTYVCCGCYMLKSEYFFKLYEGYEFPVYNVGQNFQMLLPFMYYYECPTINEPLYIVNRRTDSHSARVLTEAEEKNKYSDYENLIDDIAHIIGITSEGELRQLAVWKLNRRLIIGKKYHDGKLVRSAAIGLMRHGESSMIRTLGRIIKSF